MKKMFLTSALAAICMAPETGDAAAAPAPVVETKTVVKQNGIKRPDSTSLTGKLWDVADAISTEANRPATRKEVVERYLATVTGANEATANTQYARWVSFHGISELIRNQRKQEREAEKANANAEQIEAARLKAEEKAAKEAEKEAKKAEREKAKADREAEKARKAEEKVAAKAAKEAEAARIKAEKEAAAAQNGQAA